MVTELKIKGQLDTGTDHRIRPRFTVENYWVVLEEIRIPSVYWENRACANSVYQALSSSPQKKGLGMRLGYEVLIDNQILVKNAHGLVHGGANHNLKVNTIVCGFCFGYIM